MPPSAAPECERVGCSLGTIATSAPASCASMAARMPAHPAPTTSTSCSPITVESRYPNPRRWCGGKRLETRAGGGQLRRLRAELRLEVVPEHRSELAGFPVVLRSLAPRRARIEQPRLDAGHRQRHLEPEEVVDPVPDARELPRERSLQKGARRRDGHPLADAERTAGPAGVDEPDSRAVAVELLAEHVRVDARGLREERRAEAGRERRLGLGDADLRAGKLGGEAR